MSDSPPRGLVVVVNGRPRAGKDSFIRSMQRRLSENHDVASEEHHCIDPIRDWLDHTYDIPRDGRKSEEKRNLWASIAAAIEGYYHSLSRHTHHHCIRLLEIMQNRVSEWWERPFGVVFVHMREPDRIETLRQLLAVNGIELLTIIVERSEAMDISSPTLNASDAGSADLKGDFTVHNDYGLEYLDCQASALAVVIADRMRKAML